MTTAYRMRYTVQKMLKKTVYFRTQEDLDKFNEIDNKAEWLSNKLNQPDNDGIQKILNTVTQLKYDQAKPMPQLAKPTMHYKPTDDWGA